MANTALPETPQLDLRGPVSKGREGKEEKVKGEREEGRGKKRRCAVGIFNYFRL